MMTFVPSNESLELNVSRSVLSRTELKMAIATIATTDPRPPTKIAARNNPHARGASFGPGEVPFTIARRRDRDAARCGASRSRRCPPRIGDARRDRVILKRRHKLPVRLPDLAGEPKLRGEVRAGKRRSQCHGTWSRANRANRTRFGLPGNPRGSAVRRRRRLARIRAQLLPPGSFCALSRGGAPSRAGSSMVRAGRS